MDNLKTILKDLREGKMVVLVDDPSRENEGDLICAAETITSEQVAFMARFGRGLICAPISPEIARRLQLSVSQKRYSKRLQSCNFTESVDAASGITTGISAQDRACTIRLLAAHTTKPQQLSRPGHIFPLVASPHGLAKRDGHTEGTIALLTLAGMKPAGALCEIMGDDGRMLTGTALSNFAREHSLRIYSIADIPRKKEKNTSSLPAVQKEVESILPTDFGTFRMIVYRSLNDTKEHVLLIKGKISAKKTILTRLHSECLTGDIFHSTRCDCHWQLIASLEKMKQAPTGLLIYLRQEGRGIGLINKLRAYNLQDKGLDTVEANRRLGFKMDAREYDIAVAILKDLGVKRIRLMTNNPDKIQTLEREGIEVIERVPLQIKTKSDRTKKYLKTKKEKLGHLLDV